MNTEKMNQLKKEAYDKFLESINKSEFIDFLTKNGLGEALKIDLSIDLNKLEGEVGERPIQTQEVQEGTNSLVSTPEDAFILMSVCWCEVSTRYVSCNPFICPVPG